MSLNFNTEKKHSQPHPFLVTQFTGTASVIGCWAKSPVYIVSVFSSKGFRVFVSSDYLRPQNICAHRPGGACAIWANFLQQWKPAYRWQSNCFRWISAFLCFRSKLKNRLAPQEKVRIARCKVQINDHWPSKPSI